MLGYVMALEGEPAWSVEKAVRRFIRGDVEGHDGRFLPSSAELAKTARAETQHALKMADYETRFGKRKAVRTSRPMAKSDWRGGCPSLEEFRSWRLPEGTMIVAKDATVVLPGGGVLTWSECAGKRKKQAEAA